VQQGNSLTTAGSFGEAPMMLANTSILQRIGNILHAQYEHAQYEDVGQEPLPERWVDLIHYLNEKERMQHQAPPRLERE
jgi:hypothetical protein